MAISIVMPALEMAQENGKLVSWLKKEGESVAKGEPLLEIETDKAVMEVEAPGDGILAGIKAQPGDVIPVGHTIAWLVRPGEAPPAGTSPTESARPIPSGPAAPAPVAAASPQPAGAAVKISPKARRLAKEHGVDLARVHGSGPGGEILGTDILALVQAKTETVPVQPEVETPSAIARLMAERTAQSWTSVPHFFLVREVDAGALIATRDRLLPAIEMTKGIRPTHTDLLVALVSRVLLKHPRLNASWTGQGIRFNPEVNMAIAIAVQDAVVAPAIHQAASMDVGAIAVRRNELTERARAGRLHPSDIAGATFTLSNLGMYGVDAFSAIISPPQAAILAVARIVERVVPVEGKPGIRPMVTLTLSSDHRVVDGARAAAFLSDVAEALQDPDKWLS
jgi:pyruvate dehydrogenase E2 component (dihydrolipoamide acetyltransferase)